MVLGAAGFHVQAIEDATCKNEVVSATLVVRRGRVVLEVVIDEDVVEHLVLPWIGLESGGREVLHQRGSAPAVAMARERHVEVERKCADGRHEWNGIAAALALP